MATTFSRRAPTDCTLDGVVAYWAHVDPNGLAIDWYDGQSSRLTWGELHRRVVATAQYLRQDISPDTAVAVVCASTSEFHILVNALWRLGAGVVLIDRNWGPAIVSDLLVLLRCTTVFADSAQAVPAIGEIARRAIPALSGDVSQHEDARAVPRLDRIAIYATTSGTTDNPKCVAISHQRIRAAYDCCFKAHSVPWSMPCACLFEVNSLGVLGVCFLLQREIGVGTVCFPSFSLPTIADSWNAVVSRDFGFVYLVPPLVRLINTLPQRTAHDRQLLAFCSAAPVAETELRRFESLTSVRVFNVYGLTELTFAVFFGCRADDCGASESIGRPVGIHAVLLDDAGKHIDGPGVGELCITGPMLTDGYVRNPEATDLAWMDGWLRTGDIAERDVAGRYFIRGRRKDVVLRGGYTYYLYELEHYLRRAPAVIDACAFKGRDLPSGDELCVVVQVSETVSVPQLLDWIRENLGVNKVPNALYVWTQSIPRNSNGKTNRHLLSAMHLERRMHFEGMA